jgi:hypothetical protein
MPLGFGERLESRCDVHAIPIKGAAFGNHVPKIDPDAKLNLFLLPARDRTAAAGYTNAQRSGGADSRFR